MDERKKRAIRRIAVTTAVLSSVYLLVVVVVSGVEDELGVQIHTNGWYMWRLLSGSLVLWASVKIVRHSKRNKNRDT